MKTQKIDKPNLLGRESKGNDDNLPGYPVYPEGEDIYNVYEEEKDIDPEDLVSKKYKVRRNPEKDFDDELRGDDLDVPGSELDDDMEIIGSEDEENNYYSLSRDDQNDLDENQEE